MTLVDEDEAFGAASKAALPAVTHATSRWLLPAAFAGVLLLGAATFYGLNSARIADAGPAAPSGEARGPSRSSDLPSPPVLAPVSPLPAAPPVIIQVEQPTVLPPPPPPVVTAEPRPTTPALVIDLTPAEKPVGSDDSAARAAGGGDKLTASEAFAARVSRTAPETAGTEQLSSTDLVVPQGTVITAVLETAINSDLPGMVRAVVSRDVRGFDGSKVLIPRGSRLIGQYSNGVALGQSRAFVIWTRLLRNDGVSVQLNSAATDPLGTAGLGGRVNTHFLRRFGAATLLSVITSGLEFLVNSNSNDATNVLVGSSTQANQLASIALQREIDIPPTIKVAQGTPVRVFVARDLDFAATRGRP